MSGYITQTEFESFKKEIEKKLVGTKKEKRTRPPNDYNVFMRDEVPRLKKLEPSLSNQEIFKKGAESWKVSPLNPKNKKSS
jgi:hypothetical protein